MTPETIRLRLHGEIGLCYRQLRSAARSSITGVLECGSYQRRSHQTDERLRRLWFSKSDPGHYSVKVNALGFATVNKTGIELQVQQTARVDFSLAVCQATEIVEVNASAHQLVTENATVGTVVIYKPAATNSGYCRS